MHEHKNINQTDKKYSCFSAFCCFTTRGFTLFQPPRTDVVYFVTLSLQCVLSLFVVVTYGAKNTSQVISDITQTSFLLCFRRSTVSSILGAWLDQYSEDFWSPPNYDCLHQLLSYLHRHFLGSDLERRARNLLAHFHRRQQCEPDPDGMKAGQERAHRAGTTAMKLN